MNQIRIVKPVEIQEKVMELNVSLQRIKELKNQIAAYEKEAKDLNSELVKIYRSGSRRVLKDDYGNFIDEHGVILEGLNELNADLDNQIPIEFQLPD